MRKDRISQSLKLVTQGDDTVMVAAGEVPVLIAPMTMTDEAGWMRVLVMAMNFLRAGSPEVAIYSGYLLRCEQRHDDDGFRTAGENLNKVLKVFGDGEYYFHADVRHGGGVLHITREKYPK